MISKMTEKSDEREKKKRKIREETMCGREEITKMWKKEMNSSHVEELKENKKK